MNLDLPQIGGECQDFTRWWNSEGQFLQPMGDMDSNFTLEFSKRIAKSVFAEMERRISDERDLIEQIKSERDEASSMEKEALREESERLDRISNAIQGNKPSDAITEILEIIKEYDESHKD